MTPTEVTEILRHLDGWPVQSHSCKKVQEAIDAAVEMIERLEAAEKAVTEAYRRGYATGQEEIAAERDALRAKIETAEIDAAHQKALADSALRVAEGWERKCGELRAALQHETDCLEAAKAKIAAMKQQEPVAWARKLGLDVPSFGCVTDLKYRPSNIPESSYIPLYALPGAQPSPSVPDNWPVYADPFAYVIQHLNSNPYPLTKDETITFIKELRALYNAGPEAKP